MTDAHLEPTYPWDFELDDDDFDDDDDDDDADGQDQTEEGHEEFQHPSLETSKWQRLFLQMSFCLRTY